MWNRVAGRYGARTVARLRIALLASALALAAFAACRMGRTTIPEGADRPFDAMDRGQKAAFMAERVLPVMRETFQAFDPQRFASVDCATCHGPNAEARVYAMPNPDLPTLDPRGLYRKHRKDPAQHAIADFMWRTVQPTLARTLGVTYGPNGRIDCASCHPHDPPP